MSTTAHPHDELLILLARLDVIQVLWSLRDAPLTAPDADTSERLKELRRNDLAAYDDATATWHLTPDGHNLSTHLLTLTHWAHRRTI